MPTQISLAGSERGVRTRHVCIVWTMYACMHSIRADCTKAELACGDVHPDRKRAHVPVTLVLPPATLAQAHDMAPQYPLHPTLTSMRVRGGSAEGP